MTISDATDGYQTFAGNGAVTIFNYNKRVYAAADLVVVLRDALGVDTNQVSPADYSIVVNDGFGGAVVTMVLAPATGETLLVDRQSAISNEVDLVAAQAFPAQKVEDQMDRNVVILGDLSRKIDRSPRFPLGTNDISYPPLADGEGKALTVNAGELIWSELSSSLLPVVANSFVRRNTANDGWETANDLRARIYVAEQTGATAYDKLLAALAQAARSNSGAVVVGDPSLTIVPTAIITIPSRVEVFNNRMAYSAASLTAAYMIQLATSGEDPGFYDAVITAGATVTSAVIFGKGNKSPRVTGNEISNYTGAGIDLISDDGRALENFGIERNFLHSPIAGVGHPILIRSGPGRPFVKGGYTFANRIIGTDPRNRTNADFTTGNQYIGDGIVAQGVEDAQFINDEVIWGGSAGISVTRGSRNVRIQGHYGENLYEPLINMGSSFQIATVADLTGFVDDAGGGASITSVAAGVTGGTIETIVPVDAGDLTKGGDLWIVSLTDGRLDNGDDIVQGAASSTLTAIRHSVENCEIVDCNGVDVLIQGGNAGAINLNTARGENYVHNVKISNPRGTGNPAAVIYSAFSDCGYGRNDWRGRRAGPDQYVKVGATSTWTYTDAQDGLLSGEGSTLEVSAGGSVTPTHQFHKLDIFGGAGGTPPDLLVAVDTTNMLTYETVTFGLLTGARAVTVQDSGGSAIRLDGGDFVLDHTSKSITLARADHLASGAVEERSRIYGAGSSVARTVNSVVPDVNGNALLDPDDMDDTATTNKFTTAGDISKLAGIEASATTDQTGAEIKSAYEGEANTNAFTDAEQTKLTGIETSATADQTDAEIKTGYENNSDTNAYTDAEKAKLGGFLAASLASDTTISNDASLNNDTTLTFAVDINSTYVVEGLLFYNSPSTPDNAAFQVAFSIQTGSTLVGSYVDGATSAASDDLTVAQALIGAGSDRVSEPRGILVTDATASPFITLQWAQANAFVTDSILRAGSSIWLRKLS